MRKAWWSNLWYGSPSARLLVGIAALVAMFAFAVSGSLSRLVIVVFSGQSRGGIDETPWGNLWRAFVSDITGTPGLFVAAIKTVFAVAVAFFAVWAVKGLRGEMTLELPGVKLSGTQSRALVWCTAFAMVKLL